MFLLGLSIFISLLLSRPVLTHSSPNRVVCWVEFKNVSLPHHVFKEVICYNSWCCKNGCCPWYINLCLAAIFLLIFIVLWVGIRKCWHKYCRDMSHTTVTNDSRENILMMSANTSTCTSRDALQNYGSTVPSCSLSKDEDKPPSYEEALLLVKEN